MAESSRVTVDEIRKGMTGKPSREDVLGLAGQLLAECRRSGTSLDCWKEALDMALKQCRSVRRRS